MFNEMTQEATVDCLAKVKTNAVEYIEIPPHAQYEIRWSSESPENPDEKQALNQSVQGFGPMLIACLVD